MARGAGFTLTEALVTVVVIGIVASIAIPSYQRTFEHAFGRESETALRILYRAEQAYYNAKSPPSNVYGWHNVAGQGNDLASYIPSPLDSAEWTYTAVPGNGQTPKEFTATATRVRGPHAGKTRTTSRTGVISPDSWPPS